MQGLKVLQAIVDETQGLLRSHWSVKYRSWLPGQGAC